MPINGFSLYVEPIDVLTGDFVDTKDLPGNRRLVAGIGSGNDQVDLASVGIKEGDKFATIELTAHELEGLIDHLNLLLQAMTEQ